MQHTGTLWAEDERDGCVTKLNIYIFIGALKSRLGLNYLPTMEQAGTDYMLCENLSNRAEKKGFYFQSCLRGS